jgi:hypothetical protein
VQRGRESEEGAAAGRRRRSRSGNGAAALGISVKNDEYGDDERKENEIQPYG